MDTRTINKKLWLGVSLESSVLEVHHLGYDCMLYSFLSVFAVRGSECLHDLQQTEEQHDTRINNFPQESGLPTKPTAANSIKFTHSPSFSHHFHSKLSQKPIRPSNRAPPCHISTWATGILSWLNWSVQQKLCWYVDTHIPYSSIRSRTIYHMFRIICLQYCSLHIHFLY